MLILLGNIGDLPPEILIQIMIGVFLGVLFGMTIHEFAHNYIGHVMGDPVPAREGRLTLNPAVHINWVGFIMFALIGFGFLGSAPIAAYRMRNPRWGYLAAVAAGPVSNLLLAIVLAIIFRLTGGMGSTFSFALYMMIQMNILLFIFNLLPLYPLDGWYIVLSLLPSQQAYEWEKYAQTTQYVFLFLILAGFILPPNIDPLNIILREPIGFFSNLLMGM